MSSLALQPWRRGPPNSTRARKEKATQVTVEKLLFVIKTRTGTSRQTERPLTDQERIEGWYDGAEHRWTIYKDRQTNEGHERGRMHSMHPGQILTWNPEPGDQILCALKVSFAAEVIPAQKEPYETVDHFHFVAAHLGREVYGPSPDNHRRFVFCDSVLGRSVMLGEDGAEDAFGQDELTRTLECALEDDWRKVQCAYRLEDEPAELREARDRNRHAAYPAFRKFSEINVAVKQEAV